MVEQPLLLERTLVGDEEDEEDEIVINHHDTASNLHGEDIPFSSELGRTPINRKTVLQLEEERPDTGQYMHKSDLHNNSPLMQFYKD